MKVVLTLIAFGAIFSSSAFASNVCGVIKKIEWKPSGSNKSMTLTLTDGSVLENLAPSSVPVSALAGKINICFKKDGYVWDWDLVSLGE